MQNVHVRSSHKLDGVFTCKHSTSSGESSSFQGVSVSDPFAVGIPFSARFVSNVEVQSLRDNAEVRSKVAEKITSVDADLDSVKVIVKSNTVRVENLSKITTTDYLISRVVYCGAHKDFKDRFFFIHRSKHNKSLFAEIFWLSNPEKVRALTLLIAKAFRISYTGWNSDMMQNRINDNESLSSEDSSDDDPSRRRARSVPLGVLTKQSSPWNTKRIRSQSLCGKSKRFTRSPAVYKVLSKNEQTGSTHNVSVTVDMNMEFREQAEACSHPDILTTDLPPGEVNNFNLDLVKEYIDY